ncbi:MAG: pentapeptide repeat-containing protein [Pseudomonadota bacterium]
MTIRSAIRGAQTLARLRRPALERTAKALSAAHLWATELAVPFVGRNYLWLVFGAGGALAAIFYGAVALSILGGVADLAVRVASTAGAGNAETVWRLSLALGALLAALAAVAAIPFQLIKTWVNERATASTEQAALTARITEAVKMLGETRTVKVRRRLSAWYSPERAVDPKTEFRVRLLYEYEGEGPPLPPWHQRADPAPEAVAAALDAALASTPPGGMFAPDQRQPREDEAQVAADRLAAAQPPPIANETFIEAEETRPNIEVRLGALFALERLSQDSRRDHISLMETLCAYLRENSPADAAPGLGLPDWRGRTEGEDDASVAERRRARFGVFQSDAQACRRAGALPEPRADLQTGATILGRRPVRRIWWERRARPPYALDLRATALQRVDFQDLDLSQALLNTTRLEGANLSGALMKGANLIGARMEGADLSKARMEGADLSEARMEGADLRGARMKGADLFRARMEGADLSKARMEGANLSRARMEGANLSRARMEGADLFLARMEGADLRDARMEGALFWPDSIKSTDLRAASSRGSALRSVDFAEASRIEPDFAVNAFGDGSVTLPTTGDWAGLTPGEGRLAHWRKEVLDADAFNEAWRDWRRAERLPWPPPGQALERLSRYE